VDVGVFLDDQQVGGLTLNLEPGKVYLPLIVR